MATEDRPKSAVELALERLRQKDTDAGVVGQPPTEEQKQAIAEARSVHASKVAEREILHRSKLAGIVEPGQRVEAEEEYRRDLARLHVDLDRKIAQIRGNLR